MCCSGTIRSRGRERGFVLATTLLVTTLLTVMLAAAFLLVSAEQRMTTNSFGTAKALAIAQAGLQNYFSRNLGLDTSSTYDSTRIVESGGYADVVGRRVRPRPPGIDGKRASAGSAFTAPTSRGWTPVGTARTPQGRPRPTPPAEITPPASASKAATPPIGKP